jgi:hypothetical protein
MASPLTVRTFGTRGWGRAVLIAVAILAVVASYLYLDSPLIAIGAILLFGLAVPIYVGWTSPRQLAVGGLVVLLIGAGVFSVLYAQELRVPSPWGATLPNSTGGSVLQSAHVSPFDGAQGAPYTFSVLLVPQYIPANQTVYALDLFVSDCPGATTNDSTNCPAGYPFYAQNVSFSQNPAAPETINFTQVLPGADVWWWVMALATRDSGTNLSVPGNLTWDYVYTSGSEGVQGPVSGNYDSTVELVLPSAYEFFFVYTGLVFYVGLLVYLLLKNREARKKAALTPPGGPKGMWSSTGPIEPAGPSPTTGGGTGSPTELACPNCKAVVYPNEKTCWKCGAALPPSAGASSAPIPSSGR